MSLLKTWMGGALALLLLSSGAQADATLSKSNDPTAAVGAQLTALLGQEHQALASIGAARLQALLTPPARGAQGLRNIAYTPAWIDQQPAAKGGEQFACLADVLYFEARGDSVKGQAAVAEVVLNRVDSARFPNTVCGVVHQSNRRGCQFSWTCDGAADVIREPRAYDRVAKVARAMLDGAPRQLTSGATHFHTPAVNPAWARQFTRTGKIGSHIFYRQPARRASN